MCILPVSNIYITRYFKAVVGAIYRGFLILAEKCKLTTEYIHHTLSFKNYKIL